MALSPLAHGAETALVGLAYLSLGVLGVLTYKLARHWFGRAAGVLAAAIIVTRQPVLSFGARTYFDIAYVDLVLAALLIEVRRPRSGLPVLALLGIAGLIRPEAWLFSLAYLGYLGIATRRRPAPSLLAAAIAAPVLWLGADAVVAGDALHSLTGTRETAAQLARPTGVHAVISLAPRRLGEILREPVLVAAAVGVAFGLARRRAELAQLFAVLVLALLAFAALGLAGLPVLGRYLLVPATLVTVFAAGGALGWVRERRSPARRVWLTAGAVSLLVLAAYVPAQARRLDRLRHDLGFQESVRADLHRLAHVPALRRSPCTPLAVSTHRPLPLLAFWLGIKPSEILDSQLNAAPQTGTFVTAANEWVERRFLVDPRDKRQHAAPPPAGFNERLRTSNWLVLSRCPAR